MRKILSFIVIGVIGFSSGKSLFLFTGSSHSPLLKGFFTIQANEISETPATTPTTTPEAILEPSVVLVKRELFAVSPGGNSLAYLKDKTVFIKNKNTAEERPLLKTRLSIDDISWLEPDFIIIRTIFSDGSVTHYKKYKLDLEGSLVEIKDTAL